MSVLDVKRLSEDVVVFDNDQCAAAGAALHTQYVDAEPFPHIVLDDFVDAEVLRSLTAEWPSTDGRNFYSRAQERLKFEFQPIHLSSPKLRSFLAELNSEPMLRFLEKLTGIEKLIADPYYIGGGLHETKAGGHLGIHSDFNIHRGMNLERRINLLIYLNDDWLPEYRGDLELWSTDMRERKHSVPPVIARAVVFNTDLTSFHGVPDPVNCPADRGRRSIAMYYYTAPAAGIETLPERTTVFKVRPTSTDKVDWRVGTRHFFKDWVPPVIARALSRNRG
jgi:Rps23 Pro-64 3,4-dihydroxylase Tpa1-like proline 4-hydroxylase